MMRNLSRNCGRRAWACAWLLLGGGAWAQTPEQHWQPAPNYPANNPPNYQPANSSNPPAASANPAAGAPATTSQYGQPPDQPVGPPQYPAVERRQPADAYPPDNRGASPQNPAGTGPATAGPGGQPIQGPPLRSLLPQSPFSLTPEQAAAVDRLLADWEKRDKEIHTLESDFFRWKYDAVFGNGNPPSPEKGVLKFAAPDKGLIQIDAKEPAKSEKWVSDGKSIYQFNYAEKQVKEYVMPPELQGKGIGDGPLPFVFGVEAQKLKQRYFMRIITPADVVDAVWLEAYPRYQQQAAEFSRVQVILKIVGTDKVLFPHAIQMFSPNGKDRVVYQLQDPEVNKGHGWLSVNFERPWWTVSVPWGWEKKTELPPPPVQTGLNPVAPPRR